MPLTPKAAKEMAEMMAKAKRGKAKGKPGPDAMMEGKPVSGARGKGGFKPPAMMMGK